MASNVAHRLRRKLLAYTIGCVLISNCLVVFIAIPPLKRELHSKQAAWLATCLEARTLAASQYLNKLSAITRQITSRSMIRDKLEQYNQGRLNLEELKAYSEPKLLDALGRSPEAAGMTRLDAGLRPVLTLGDPMDPGFLPPGFSEGDAVWTSEPYILHGHPAVNVAANILDSGGGPIGMDIVAFRLDNVLALVEGSRDMGRTGAGALCHADKQRDGGRPHPVLESSPSQGLCRALADSGRFSEQFQGQALETAPGDGPAKVLMHRRLDHGEFLVAVAIDRAELYGPANRTLLLVGGLIVLAVLGSVIGAYWLLRPLAGRFLLREEELGSIIADKTRELERELAENSALSVELKAAGERSEAASRAKSVFLANMSHDLRTPLHGILGMLQLLQTTDPDSEQSEYIASAVLCVKRLSGLLSDILDLSKVEEGKLVLANEAFDPGGVFQGIRDIFALSAREKGLELRTEVSDDVPQLLMGDAARLQQILTNLVGNAVKFTSRGGVEVTARSLP